MGIRRKTCRALLLASAVLLPYSQAASGDELSGSTQLGASRVSVTYPSGVRSEHWRIWSRRSDGQLLSLRDGGPEGGGDPYPLWDHHGNPLGHAVGSQGVSATWWTESGSNQERAYFLDGNTVIEVRAKDGSVQGSRSWGPPIGTTLTGYFSATRAYSATLKRWIGLVYATVKDAPSSTWSRLMVLEVDGANATWYQAGSSYQFSNTGPIAASSSPDGLYARGFAATTAGSLVTSRWNLGSHSGTVVNLSTPVGKQLCGTIAAAEGASGPSGAYRAYVFCTRRNGAESQVLFRFSTSPTGGGGTWPAWGAIQTNAGNVRNTGYALSATASNSDVASYAHVFVLTSSNRLLVANSIQATGEMPPAFTDLGDDGEYVSRRGGMAAVPFQIGEAWGLYTGPSTTAPRLYRRFSAGAEQEPSVWRNHGSGNGFGFIASTDVSQGPSTALWRARAITASVRGAQGALPTVYARWSSDDAENWTVGTPLARGTTDDNTFVFSPVTGFTDIGRAYVQMVGWDNANDSCSLSDAMDSEVYVVTTTNGVAFADPVRIVGASAYHPCDPPAGGACAGDEPWCPPCQNEICGPLDTCRTAGDDCYCHEDFLWNRIHAAWIAVEQRTGAADMVHSVWFDNNPTVGGKARDGIFYARATDPIGPDPAANLLQTAENVMLPAGAPVATVGAEGAVYVGTAGGLCRVNPAGDGCVDVLDYGEYGIESQGQTLAIPGTSGIFSIGIAGAPFALVASRIDPEKVYYAFQRYESQPGPAPLDLWFQTITFDTVSGLFDPPGPPFPLTDVQADGTDQFQPSLTVMAQTAPFSDSVYASWYDRREACLGLANRCYRGKRAIYSIALGAFGWVQDLPINISNTLSDPLVLPVPQCGSTRNLGPWHHVTADRLHSFHNIVGAELGLPFSSATLARGWVSRGFWSWSY